MAGLRFGRLLVAEWVYSGANATFWRCQCDCGQVVVVKRCNLIAGNTRSCGCIRESKRRPVRAVHPVVAQLHAKRRENRMTLTHVAERAGFAHQTLGEAERGVNNPSLHLLECWAAALGLEITIQEKRND